MDTFRYFIALLLLMCMPAPLIWFSVHPFIRFWRKVGAATTLSIHYALILALAGAVYFFRRSLLAVEYGTNWWLIGLAVVLMTAAVVMRWRLGRQLHLRILVGLPELAPEGRQGKLLKDGIYARIRHPRYVELVVAIFAYALAANYLAVYVLALLTPLALFLVVLLEERELRERFGAEYDEYCAQVPRFIPKFK